MVIDPADCDWGGRGIDLVMECTGIFTDADKARISMPALAGCLSPPRRKGADATIVYGVNHASLTAEHGDDLERVLHRQLSRPLWPAALHAACGIKQGFMTTIHAYTGDQNLVDGDRMDFLVVPVPPSSDVTSRVRTESRSGKPFQSSSAGIAAFEGIVTEGTQHRGKFCSADGAPRGCSDAVIRGDLAVKIAPEQRREDFPQGKVAGAADDRHNHSAAG